VRAAVDPGTEVGRSFLQQRIALFGHVVLDRGRVLTQVVRLAAGSAGSPA
jgi:hypothetical protein